MKILALDTSADVCSVALLDGEQVRERESDARQQHAELLLPMVRELLDEAGCELRQLDTIAFSAGPGAFTGVRIACSIAQGLALGANLSVVSVSTLLALAHQSAPAQMRIIAALDARMGEIYHAAYVRDGVQWTLVSEPCVCAPEQAPLVSGEDWSGIGSGFAAYPTQLSARYGAALTSVDAGASVRAADIARLGALALERGEAQAPHLAQPIYVRDKVALTSVEQAQSRTNAAATRR